MKILFSQFEEKIEEINAVEAPSALPSTSGFNENETATLPTEESGGVDGRMDEKENQSVCADVGTSQDFASGIMKIVSDVDVCFSLQALKN